MTDYTKVLIASGYTDPVAAGFGATRVAEYAALRITELEEEAHRLKYMLKSARRECDSCAAVIQPTVESDNHQGRAVAGGGGNCYSRTTGMLGKHTKLPGKPNR